MEKTSELKSNIKEKAGEFGFSRIGFARAAAVDEKTKRFYLQWLENGCHGEMKYLEGNLEKRFDPTILVPGAKTVISLATNYNSEFYQNSLFPGYVTKKDYHKILKKRMRKFYLWMKNIIPGIEGRFFVDSAPVLEKYWAQKAGIGWIGKNTNLITKEYGSRVFLSEIIINVEIEPDLPHKNLCCLCSEKCIESCPAGAIMEKGGFDAGKCIAYLTIEKKSKLNKKEKDLLNNYLFGCDICQIACLWNSNTEFTGDSDLKSDERIHSKNLNFFKKFNSEEFEEFFSGTVVKRMNFEKFKEILNVLLKKNGLLGKNRRC